MPSRNGTKKLQIFISSTYEDLKTERQSAVTEILHCGHIPAGMELFAAGDQAQETTIHEWIDDSDVFMLILGERYGSIEPKSGKSYTQLEYEYAVQKGKPLFAIVLDAAFMASKAQELAANKKDPHSIVERHEPNKLAEFRKLVLSKLCCMVKDESDLRLGVNHSIRKIERAHDLVGWIRGDCAVDEQVISQLAALGQESLTLRTANEKLTKELDLLRAGQSKTAKLYAGRTFEELLSVLQRESVDHEGENHNALDLLRRFRLDLLTGVFRSNKLQWQLGKFLLLFDLTDYDYDEDAITFTPDGKRFLSDLTAKRDVPAARTLLPQLEKGTSQADDDIPF